LFVGEGSKNMTGVEKCKNLFIGSGEAGKFLAWTLAKEGQPTVLERRLIGGACPNIACLPGKNVIHSAKVVSLARRGRGIPTQNRANRH
jgi:pyruvate/2-oxoglutarate dehydrogenase complex dihydrolipoamide dehydrogenase (E3) component